jgi:hypothetical protein
MYRIPRPAAGLTKRGEQSETVSSVLKEREDSVDKTSKSADNVFRKFEVIDSGVKTVSGQEENIRNGFPIAYKNIRLV